MQAELPLHPFVALFPPMSDEEYASFREDIRKNGVREPICLYNGQIIDGRNRYRACCDLGITAPTREWGGNGSLVDFVVSANLYRRHLTTSQKAAVAVAIKAALETEARERQRMGGKLKEKFPEAHDQAHEKGQARDLAGTIVGVSGRYVDEAERIKDASPHLFGEVHRGEKTLQEAKREIRHAEVVKTAQLPSDRYRVFYADPPWKYNNSGLDDYGHAERHYPTMSIDELTALDVASIVEDNAVLFLWAPSPMLEAAFEVINAWRFTYKGSFIWDKIKHNYGHYNSVRHEHLLVCARGSCTPDTPRLFDSVQSIERSDKHSEKPVFFRNMIDELYPYGNRIELWPRGKRPDGWDVWGGELDD